VENLERFLKSTAKGNFRKDKQFAARKATVPSRGEAAVDGRGGAVGELKITASQVSQPAGSASQVSQQFGAEPRNLHA